MCRGLCWTLQAIRSPGDVVVLKWWLSVLHELHRAENHLSRLKKGRYERMDHFISTMYIDVWYPDSFLQHLFGLVYKGIQVTMNPVSSSWVFHFWCIQWRGSEKSSKTGRSVIPYPLLPGHWGHLLSKTSSAADGHLSHWGKFLLVYTLLVLTECLSLTYDVITLGVDACMFSHWSQSIML